jgi:hypothetical protein
MAQLTDAGSGTIRALILDGKVRARRTDGYALTENDWGHVYNYLVSSPAAVPLPIPIPFSQPDSATSRSDSLEDPRLSYEACYSVVHDLHKTVAGAAKMIGGWGMAN